MKEPIRARPRKRLVALGVGTILLTGSAVLWIERGYQDERKGARGGLQAEAQALATAADSFFRNRFAVLRTAAAGPTVVAFDLPRANAYMSRVIGESGLTSLSLSDRNGVVRAIQPAVSQGAMPSIRIADRDYFRASMRGSSYVGSAVVAREQTIPVVVAAVPVRNDSGRPIGVLAAALELDSFEPSQAEFPAPDDGMTILDRRDQVVASDDPIVSLSGVSDPGLLERLRGAQGAIAADRGFTSDAEMVIASADARVPGWTLVIERDPATLYASARRGAIARLLGVVLAVGAIAGILGWLLVRATRQESAREEQWRAAERTAHHAAIERDLTLALGSAETVGEVLATAATRARAAVEADTAVAAWRRGDGGFDTAHAVSGKPLELGVWDARTDHPCAEVARTVRPHLAEHGGEPARGMSVVPIVVDGRPSGSLALIDHLVAADPDHSLVASVAAATGIALSRAAAIAATRRELELSERLRRLTLAIALSPTADASAAAFADGALREFAASYVAIYRHEGERSQLWAFTGDAGARPPEFLVDDAPHRWARSISSGDVAYVTSPADDGYAGAVVPLPTDDQPTGVMVMVFARPRHLDQREKDFISHVGGQCGRALERALLAQSSVEARTEAEATSRRLAAVYALTTALTQAASVEDTAVIFSTEGIPTLGADRGGLYEWSPAERALVLRAPDSSHAVRPSINRIPIDGDVPICRTLREQQPVFLRTPAEVSAYSAEAAAARAEDDLAIAVLPVSCGKDPWGVMCVRFCAIQTFDEDQQEFLRTAAKRVGDALERAQLFSIERDARVAADAARRRAMLRAEIGSQLEATRGSVGRVQRLADLLAGGFADHVIITSPVPEGSASHHGSIADEGKNVLARAGSPPSSSSAPRTTVDVSGAGRLVDAITLERHSMDRPFTDTDVAFAKDVGGRAALSIENEQFYEREHSVAVSLQLDLLGVAPMGDEDLDVASLYQAGSAELQVGGDWFDLIRLPTGKVVLVVGDVVGRGLRAAAVMGQLRSAVRALVLMNNSPAKALEQLDMFVGSIPEAAMTTLCLVTLDPATGDVWYACAGHPPPLFLGDDGAARFEWGGRSAPVGAFAVSRREEGRAIIDAGTTIVLYTDGLIERRGRSLDDGLGQLHDAAVAADALRPLPEQIVEAMFDDPFSRDDVAILAVRLRRISPQSFASRFPADPGELSKLRHAFARWCEARAIERADVVDLVLAMGEAASNAVEHAYIENEPGHVAVTARLEADNDIVVEISDEGTWRVPPAPGNRGRGIDLVRTLSDSVGVERRGSGTTLILRRRVRRWE